MTSRLENIGAGLGIITGAGGLVGGFGAVLVESILKVKPTPELVNIHLAIFLGSAGLELLGLAVLSIGRSRYGKR